MSKAVIVTVSGTKSVIDFPGEDAYKTLSSAVEGYIQPVYLPSKEVDMWVHEEGKIINLPINSFGTELWEENYGFSDVILGNIIITGLTDDNGDTLGLTDEQVSMFV